jgi:CubicO group peptidase (beta-lactamase class C family)
VSDAASLALFYQGLLHNPAGIWKDELLRDVTGNVRNHFPDLLTGLPIERTLGLCTAGKDGKGSLRGFGKTTSGRAFGHGGAAGQVAWADPETGISFCYLTNGVDANFIRIGRRGVALSSIAAETA